MKAREAKRERVRARVCACVCARVCACRGFPLPPSDPASPMLVGSCGALPLSLPGALPGGGALASAATLRCRERDLPPPGVAELSLASARDSLGLFMGPSPGLRSPGDG